MRRFDSLADGAWAGEGPWPHVLVLPRSEAYREFWAAHQPVWEPYEGCLVPIPFEWTHVTVASVRHRVGAAVMDDLAGELAAEMGRVAPFRVRLGPSRTAQNGVTVAMSPELPVTRVHDGARAALSRVSGIRVEPQVDRYWPHTALAYCVKSFDSSGLNAFLYRDFRPSGVDMVVDRVHLVQQRQVSGRYYTWEVHSVIPLAAEACNYRLDFVDGGGTRHDVEEIWVSSEAQAVAWARTRWSEWRPRGEKFVRVWRIGEGGEDRLVATVDGGR